MLLDPSFQLQRGLHSIRCSSPACGGATPRRTCRSLWLRSCSGRSSRCLSILVALRALGLPVAIVAGLGMAPAPESASYATIALTETLYTFLLIGFVWLWGKQRGFLAVGPLLGAAALVRSNAIVLVPLIGLMGLVWGFNRTIHLRIALAAVLVIAPWVARNYATQHEFTPIATYGWGSVLFYSTVDVPYYSGNPFTVWLADKEAQAIYAVVPSTPCSLMPPSSRRFGTNRKGPHRLPLESSDGISAKLPRSRRLIHADNSAAGDRCKERVLGGERDLRHTVRLGHVFGPQGVATNVFHRSGATRFCGHAVCGRGQPALQHRPVPPMPALPPPWLPFTSGMLVAKLAGHRLLS